MISLEAVEALDTLLGTAMRVIDELRHDGLLQRLVGVLGCMLPEDRETILQVLEHDADTHTKLDESNLWARSAVRPNPFAHLYTRNTLGGRTPGVRYLEIRRATSVGARMARSLPPWGEGGWERETVDAWRRLPAEERAQVVSWSRRVLAVLEPNRRRPSRV